MKSLTSTDSLLAASYREEPFRFTRRLPLILTKLTPPRSPGVLLERDRLLARLDEAADGALTLICAAAGSGKTTLLAQWYRRRREQGDAIGWLSLEEDENDPAQFARYLVTALKPLYSGWGEALEPFLQGDMTPDLSVLLAELTNQLHCCPHPVWLILDDYHALTHPALHEGISWLINHAPDSLHLIIGSRFRPPLALSRLALQDALKELHDEDLRFTLAEAQDYLSDAARTAIPGAQDVQRLMLATEGWVAGIKIAALAPDWHHDPQRFLARIPSGSRTLARYLDEVIFTPLPEAVVDFLLQTAILNRLTPALCDALTGRKDGEAMLGWIQHHNLFITALDEHGGWFRYHHLMRDALLARLQQSEPARVRQLHERASNWFAGQQLWAEAVRHALAAGKSGARHAEASAQSLAEEGDIDTLVRWMHFLPLTPDPSRIDLQLNLAWALAHHFRFQASRELLDGIDAMTHDAALTHSVRVKLRVVRAICEAFAENIELSVALVEPLLAEIPCGDRWVDGLVCNILSYCHLANARPGQALAVQSRLPELKVANRNLFVDVWRAFVIAQAHLRQGNLADAKRVAAQTLQAAEAQTGSNSSSGATLAPILAEVAWERDERQDIDALLVLRLEMIETFCPPEGLSRCFIVLSRQAALNGQLAEAKRLLTYGGELTRQRQWLRAQAALLAETVELHLRDEALSPALETLDTLRQLHSEDAENGAIGFYRRVSESRIALAEGHAHQAAAAFAALADEQQQRGEARSALRLRLAQAAALWHAGAYQQAGMVFTSPLQQALEQGLLRSLLDLGAVLVGLLDELLARQTTPEALRQQAATLRQQAVERFGLPPKRHDEAEETRYLTEREQQTLELIASGHSNKEIARVLGISAETVKWHLKQMYEKLQVSSRMQAVNQAREWKLLKVE